MKVWTLRRADLHSSFAQAFIDVFDPYACRYAREGVQIFIDDEAAEAIVEYYSELRRLSKDRCGIWERLWYVWLCAYMCICVCICVGVGVGGCFLGG